MGKRGTQEPPGLPETKCSASIFQHQGPPPHCRDQSVTTELSIWVTKTWLLHHAPFASSLVADVVNGGGRKERARAQKQDEGSGLVQNRLFHLGALSPEPPHKIPAVASWPLVGGVFLGRPCPPKETLELGLG